MSKLWHAITALQEGDAALSAQIAAHGEVVGDIATQAGVDALSAKIDALTTRVTEAEDWPSDAPAADTMSGGMISDTLLAPTT